MTDTLEVQFITGAIDQDDITLAPVTIIEVPTGLITIGSLAETVALSAATNITQAHTFSYLPNVLLVDAGGNLVDADVSYPDASHVHLSFPSPFTGTLVLS